MGEYEPYAEEAAWEEEHDRRMAEAYQQRLEDEWEHRCAWDGLEQVYPPPSVPLLPARTLRDHLARCTLEQEVARRQWQGCDIVASDALGRDEIAVLDLSKIRLLPPRFCDGKLIYEYTVD